MSKSSTLSKGYTLVANVDLIFPVTAGRTHIFVVATTATDLQVAYGYEPAPEDFVPFPAVENPHLLLEDGSVQRMTLRSVAGGDVVVMTDAHRTLDGIKPVFYDHPESIKALHTDAFVYFNVDVENDDAPFSYAWFVDGVQHPVDHSDIDVKAQAVNGSVVYCVVTNTVTSQSTESRKAFVTFLDEPALIAVPPSDGIVPAGADGAVQVVTAEWAKVALTHRGVVVARTSGIDHKYAVNNAVADLTISVGDAPDYDDGFGGHLINGVGKLKSETHGDARLYPAMTFAVGGTWEGVIAVGGDCPQVGSRMIETVSGIVFTVTEVRNTDVLLGHISGGTQAEFETAFAFGNTFEGYDRGAYVYSVDNISGVGSADYTATLTGSLD